MKTMDVQSKLRPLLVLFFGVLITCVLLIALGSGESLFAAEAPVESAPPTDWVTAAPMPTVM